MQSAPSLAQLAISFKASQTPFLNLDSLSQTRMIVILNTQMDDFCTVEKYSPQVGGSFDRSKLA